MTGSLDAETDTPYSSVSHFAVAGSISAMLNADPCFLQNPSKERSVTNVSITFN